MIEATKNFLIILGSLAVFHVILIPVDALLFRNFKIGADSTDGESRSGMALHMDAKTGCEYLASPWGGITPRLTADGKHICNN